MIPKIIHYVWLGGARSHRVSRDAFETGKKLCQTTRLKNGTRLISM